MELWVLDAKKTLDRMIDRNSENVFVFVIVQKKKQKVPYLEFFLVFGFFLYMLEKMRLMKFFFKCLNKQIWCVMIVQGWWETGLFLASVYMAGRLGLSIRLSTFRERYRFLLVLFLAWKIGGV